MQFFVAVCSRAVAIGCLIGSIWQFEAELLAKGCVGPFVSKQQKTLKDTNTVFVDL